MEPSKQTVRGRWDPYAVWKRLLRNHPVHDQDPAGSCGRIDRGSFADFCEAIMDYPDYLQDALLVIAHARGPEFAVHALDDAVREQLFGPSRRLPVAVAPGDARSQP
ncbi:MAG TPA: hypothetical protein PLS34_05795 [Gammaproteobacteria bacterium]|nr:hypothetical protein [Gammaproteobacteria bacterium]